MVWRFLSGTWPSQRPDALSLFVSMSISMSMSVFQLAYPHCLSSFHYDYPMLVMPLVLLLPIKAFSVLYLYMIEYYSTVHVPLGRVGG